MRYQVSGLIFFLISMALLSCGRQLEQFDGNEAFLRLTEQSDLGARYPGSEEIELCREYIKEKLTEYGAKITEQKFKVEIDDQEIEGENIIASFYPRLGRRVLLGAHYDTRPWADKDELPENHKQPVIGANDGASGVAVLLEIARLLSDKMPPEYGVDLVFFDLEDMGTYQENDTWCLGSSYFAHNFSGELPEKAIIVDMVGDLDLSIPIEHYSYHNSPQLVREVWDIAGDLGFTQFKNRIDNAVYDDHYPLIKEGFQAILIIDFDYEWWHTVHDTPDKCSPASLKAVGQVLTHLIYQGQP